MIYHVCQNFSRLNFFYYAYFYLLLSGYLGRKKILLGDMRGYCYCVNVICNLSISVENLSLCISDNYIPECRMVDECVLL